MAAKKKATKRAVTPTARTLEERFDALRLRLLAYMEAGPAEAGDVEVARQALLGELKS
jgi:hypothetical protein